MPGSAFFLGREPTAVQTDVAIAGAAGAERELGMGDRESRDELRRRFMRPIGAGMTLMCLVAGMLSWLAVPWNAGAMGLWSGALVSIGSLVAIHRANTRLAVFLVTHFFLMLPTAIFIARPEIVGPAMTGLTAALVISLSAFLIGAKSARNLGILAMVCIVAVGVRLRDPSQWQSSNATVQTVASVSLLAMTVTVLLLFVRDERRLRHDLEKHAAKLERVVADAHEVAKGDLRSATVVRGEVDDVMLEMVAGLREMVEDVRAIVVEVGGASGELATASRAHATGATSQAAAVGEIGQTLDQLSRAAVVMAEGSVDVVDAAEQSLTHNREIVTQMETLGDRTERISEVVSLIRTVADKVEMLALNAALEGVRAGEAGEGFTLVAAEMRNLAEEVVQSLEDVRSVTTDIATAARHTTEAATQGHEIAERTAAASRRMREVSAQQAESIKGAATATDDIARVAREISESSAETLHASAELKSLADRLEGAVRRFQT